MFEALVGCGAFKRRMAEIIASSAQSYATRQHAIRSARDVMERDSDGGSGVPLTCWSCRHSSDTGVPMVPFCSIRDELVFEVLPLFEAGTWRR